MTEASSPEATALLRRIADARPQPSADLWTRIAAAHMQRAAHRRRRRFAAGGVLCATLVGAIALGGLRLPSVAPNRSADIDWQARAQALESRFRSLQRERGAATVTDADPAAIELDDVDQRLRGAYERGAYAGELAPLWKRRSELLDTLITARKEGLKLTRI